MKVLYTANATATGGREGRVRSSDGYLDLVLQPPKEIGGPGDEATNPEQLFAAGYGACFLSALKLVAGGEKIRTREFSVDASVELIQDADDGVGVAAQLRCQLPGVEPAQARELMERAHRVCPYSKATRGNIDVTLFAGETPVSEAAGV